MKALPVKNSSWIWSSIMAVGLTFVAGSTLPLPLSDALALDRKDEIGFIIAVQGRVSLTSAEAVPRPASLRQSIFPHDVIRTDPNGEAKILFDDNTTLSVTEDTEIEITEYVYDPQRAQRSAILSMLQGRVKAMVAHFYAATSSRFEIHTPTAVAAARGTEYVVWTSTESGEPTTGIAVTDGTVMVTNRAKESVAVLAGHFTVASRTGSPTPPAPIAGSREAQFHIHRSELKTDPAIADHVKMTMDRQEQVHQRSLEALTRSDGSRVKEEAVQFKAEKSGNDPAEKLERGAKPNSVSKVERVEGVELMGRVESSPERRERPQRPERPERPLRHHVH